MKYSIQFVLLLVLVNIFCIGHADINQNLDNIATIQERAKSGDAKAQLIIGVMYYRGQGVKKNDDLAFYWYQKSA